MPLGKLENNLMRKINFLRTVFYASLFVLVSCKDDQISYYQAPKDAPPKMPPPAQHSGSTSDAEPQGHVHQVVDYPQIPQDWTAIAAGQFAKNKWTFGEEGKTVEFSVTSFPGKGGTLLQNVNRWRGQVGLAKQTEEELQESLNTLATPVGEMKIVELYPEDKLNKGMFVAILYLPDEVWFFKAYGNQETLAAKTQELQTWLQNLREHRH